LRSTSPVAPTVPNFSRWSILPSPSVSRSAIKKPGCGGCPSDAGADADGDIDVAVRRHRQVTSGAEVVGDDHAAKARRQRQPAVVWVTGGCRRALPAHAGGGGKHAGGNRGEMYQSTVTSRSFRGDAHTRAGSNAMICQA
jgi:hypothetical protein